MLAHSGGLETSVAIPWLRQKYGADVSTVTVDLGRVIRMKADAFAQSAVAIR
jgi:argininosuccinate synthase